MLQIGIEAVQAQPQTVSLGQAIRNAVAKLSYGMERNTGIAIEPGMPVPPQRRFQTEKN